MSSSSNVFSLLGQGLKLDTRADIEPHLRKLRMIPHVEEIHLGGNTLGVEACVALAEELRNINTLKVADFADIFTGRLITEIPQSLAALCDALVDKPTLIELNLNDNAFGGRSAEPMVNFLTHNRTFQVLKLNNNGLGITGGTIVANALLESANLSKAAGTPSNLRTVICGRNRLENGSAPVWADAFAAHGNLVEVKMPQNGIRMEGIAALAEGLSKCPTLEHLDFQDNTCTESGTRAIAKALPSWPALRSLNLSDCLLSGKGGIALVLSLSAGKNARLEALKLQYGELDHRSLNPLAKAIQDQLPNLVLLELNGNRADPEDECITNVRDALEGHGHGDALDELDDMEDYEEEEEEEDSAVVEEAKAEEDREDTAGVDPSTGKGAGNDDVDVLSGLLGKMTMEGSAAK